MRSDVSPAYANYVTATQSFGIDIMVDSIANCHSVTFDLVFDKAQYIRYSSWAPRSFPRNSTILLDNSNDTTGQGRLSIAVLSGSPTTDVGRANPNVIHLDFVVTPNAPHNLNFTMGFQFPLGVVQDSAKPKIPLAWSNRTFNIHSFVNIYPGDANDDGLVDTRDAAQIAVYMDAGSGGSTIRGFMRENASTLWSAQRTLVWDDELATYADCDGSGDVTIIDLLVVNNNYGKLHSKTKTTNEVQTPPVTPELNDIIKVPLFVREPVLALTAVAGKVQVSDGYEIVSVSAGSALEIPGAIEFSRNRETKSSAIFSVGYSGFSSSFRCKNNVADVLIRRISSDATNNPTLRYSDLAGSTIAGTMIELEQSSSVASTVEEELSIEESFLLNSVTSTVGGQFTIANNYTDENALFYRIYNLRGQFLVGMSLSQKQSISIPYSTFGEKAIFVVLSHGETTLSRALISE